jgi:malonate transporter, MadL subunit
LNLGGVIMAIYGVALLAACYIVGIVLGDLFGVAVGVKANVGGVGFAMLFLILLSNHGIDHGWLDKKAQSGIAFWSAMYIPIVVAMSSIQNVVAALKGGPLAIGAGLVGVAVAFAFIPIIARFSSDEKEEVK